MRKCAKSKEQAMNRRSERVMFTNFTTEFLSSMGMLLSLIVYA
jgi:hypothetical protein